MFMLLYVSDKRGVVRSPSSVGASPFALCLTTLPNAWSALMVPAMWTISLVAASLSHLSRCCNTDSLMPTSDSLHVCTWDFMHACTPSWNSACVHSLTNKYCLWNYSLIECVLLSPQKFLAITATRYLQKKHLLLLQRMVWLLQKALLLMQQDTPANLQVRYIRSYHLGVDVIGVHSSAS